MKTYYFNSGTYQAGAGYGYGGYGGSIGYSNTGGTTIGGGYGAFGANYGLQSHNTRYTISMDDRALIKAYNDGVSSQKYNGYGAEGGNKTFNKIIDFLGTVAAGYQASDNHDAGYEYQRPKTSTDFGLFGDMVSGSLSNRSQPAGLVRAGVGLAISPIYYGAVAGFGGSAYRAGYDPLPRPHWAE